MAKKKILITGANGMLGKDLVQAFLKEYDLVGVGHIEDPAMKIEYHCVNITESENITHFIVKHSPDIVIHTAAFTNVDACETEQVEAFKVNCQGTENVVSACNKINAYLFFISTDYVFDGTNKIPYKESDQPNPVSIYGETKYKAEQLIQEKAKRHTIIRTSWLYGKNGKNFVDTIIRMSENSPTLKIVSDQIGRPTYTVDLANALNQLLKIYEQEESRIKGIIHVTNSGFTSWFDFAKEILKQSHKNNEVVPITTEELARPANRPKYSVLDLEKFNTITGKPIRSWQEALSAYLKNKKLS